METQCTVCGKKLDGREFHSHTHVMINKDKLAALEAVAEAARTGVGLDNALDALDALKGVE